MSAERENFLDDMDIFRGNEVAVFDDSSKISGRRTAVKNRLAKLIPYLTALGLSLSACTENDDRHEVSDSFAVYDVSASTREQLNESMEMDHALLPNYMFDVNNDFLRANFPDLEAGTRVKLVMLNADKQVVDSMYFETGSKSELGFELDLDNVPDEVEIARFEANGGYFEIRRIADTLQFPD